MRLNTFACSAIHRHIVRYCPSQAAIDRDPKLAAWLVWSMRGTPAAKTDHETFNRA
ncbi:hypothetical protein JG659_19450, partial [Vibrio cholerae]|nr:hypothetical protein [Vibrio cholerae]